MNKRRLLLLLSGAGLLILAVAVVAVHSPPAKRYLSETLRQTLRDSQGLDLAIGKLDYSLLRLSLSARDVSARLAAPDDSPPFLHVESLHFRLDPRGAFEGRIVVAEAEIRGLRLSVRRDGAGKLNLPLGEGEADEPGGLLWTPAILIQQLSVSNASLQVVDEPLDLEFLIPDWSLEIRGDPSLRHSVRLHSAGEGAFRVDQVGLPVRELAGELDLNPVELRIETLRVGLGSSRLEANGSIEDWISVNPRLNVELAVRALLEEITPLLGVDEAFSGWGTLTATARGPLDRADLMLEIGSEDLVVPHLGSSSLDVRIRRAAPEKALQLTHLGLRSGLGEIRGEGRLAWTDEGDSHADLRLERLNLEQLDFLFPGVLPLAGEAAGSLRLSCPGLRIDRLRGQADLRFDPGRAAGAPERITIAGALRAEMDLDRVTLAVDRIRFLEIQVDGRAEVDLPEGPGHPGAGSLRGEFRVQADSLGSAARNLDSAVGWIGEETLENWRPDGSAQMLVRLGGTLENPAVGGSLTASDVRFRDLTGITLAARAVYEGDTLGLEYVRGEWEGRELTGRGRIVFADPTPSLDLTARLDQLPISALEHLLELESPLQGFVESQIEVAGTVDDPRSRVRVQARELEAYGEPLGGLDLTGHFSGSRFELEAGEWTKPGLGGDVGVMRLQGAYDLETGSYELRAKGSDLVFQKATLPGEVVVAGTVDIEAEGAGTGLDASLDLEAAVRNLRLQGHPLGRLNVAAGLRDGAFSSRVELIDRRLQVQARGRVSSPYPFELEADLDQTDLASLPLEGVEGLPLTGRVTGRLRASANLDEWRQARVEVETRLLDAALGGREIQAEDPIRVSFREGGLELVSGRIELGASHLQVEGRLPLEGEGLARVRAGADVEELLALMPGMAEYAAVGRVELDGVIRGSLARIDPEIRLSMRNGQVEVPGLEEPLSELDVILQIEDGSLRVSKLSGRLGEGRLRADAEIPLELFPVDLPFELFRREGPGRGSLSVQGIDLHALGVSSETAEGGFSMSVEIEATSLDLSGLRADARIEELWARIEGREFRQEAPGGIRVEEGVVTVERLRLTGPQMNLRVSGTADLGPPGAWDLQVEGALDLSTPAALIDGLQAAGPARVRLDLKGPLADPRFNGSLEIERGQAAVRVPSLRAQDLQVSLTFTPERLEIQRLEGALNGGTIRGSGGVGYSAAGLEDVSVDLEADEVLLDFPEGVRTLSRGSLRLRSQDEGFVLGGRLEVLEGFHRETISLEGELFRYLRSGRLPEAEQVRSPLLARLRFDLGLDTLNPIVIENNLARLLLTTRLRLVGRYYRPALIGRIDFEEGGELYLRERTFVVERGRVSFFDETQIRPEIDVLARTQTRGYDIALQLSGDPENLTSTLSSDPALSEPDIVALLITGRRLEELRGAEADVAREQALSYLAGGVSGRLEREAEAALGLSQVRIEPHMVSPESSPGARLTVGQDITSRLTLIYSMNLVDSGDQIYIADYAVTPRLNARGVKQEDNTYRFEFGHELRFGEETARAPRTGIFARRPTVGEVVFEGLSPFTEQQLAGRLGVREGGAYSFFDVHQGMERLKTLFTREDLLEARLRLERTEADSRMDLKITVEAGPRVVFRFKGDPLPAPLQRQVRQVWIQGLSEAHRLESSLAAMQEYLRNRGYLEAEIDSTVTEPVEGLKEVVFEIRRGVLYRERELVLEGASRIAPDRLRGALEGAGLMDTLYADPQPAADLVATFYRQEGYLAVRVASPRTQLDPSRGAVQVAIEIEEGPAFHLGRVEIAGNRALGTEELLQAMPLASGRPYQPRVRADALRSLEERYLREGFNAVRITETASRDPEAGSVDLFFDIEEGPLHQVSEIGVEGNVRTTSAFVKRHLPLAPGDPLNFEKIGRARRSLYGTGAFTLVEIETEARDPGEAADGVQPTRIEVRVREQSPYTLRYGGFYDTDRGPGAITDLTTRNVIGSGRILGLRGRYDGEFRELRGYSSQHHFLNLPVTSSLTVLLRRELRGAFVTDRKGVALEQQAKLRDSLLLSYGYRFDRVHTFDRTPSVDTPAINVASLTATLGRDTRDDLLDAHRGSFFSHAAQFAPEVLGSDARFVKYFGQYFHYFPLSAPAEIPLSGGLKRPRLVFGTGVRVGLARGLGGQTLPLGERFLAGGGTTIRGFGQHEVGPRDDLGNPVGGDAVLMLNNEIRFPMVSIFEGVAFLDAGNVYPQVSDFDPLDLRKAAGVGLRIRTPYVLLRLDYGFKLGLEPGESRGALFFSIGQAF